MAIATVTIYGLLEICDFKESRTSSELSCSQKCPANEIEFEAQERETYFLQSNNFWVVMGEG
jgi:hypothetical protein